MKVKAAVAWGAGKPLSIETVDLEGPRQGEVLVEIKATGICHTDYYTLSEQTRKDSFPWFSVMKAQVSWSMLGQASAL